MSITLHVSELGLSQASTVSRPSHCAVQVFGDSYKWILYGDDDTMWFVEGLLPFLEDFDPELPYFVTGETCHAFAHCMTAPQASRILTLYIHVQRPLHV